MAERNPLRRFLDRPNDDPAKAIGVAAIVAALCALVLSVSAVLLRPLQEENRLAARAGQMAAMLEAVPGIAELLENGGIETHVVDLATGRISDTDPASFDQAAAAQDPERSTALTPAQDLAAISRRENESLVWMVREGDDLRLVVLPVRGAGYQSMIHAYLALEGDRNTVAAYTVYHQGEPPALAGGWPNPPSSRAGPASRWPRVETQSVNHVNIAAIATAAAKFLASLSYLVAMPRQSLRRQNARSILLRCR